MKRYSLVIIGLVACVAAYACVYFASTKPARELKELPAPELAWLREEFNLSDSEYKRISDLHASYLPKCREMCTKIDAKNSELRRLLETSTNVTTQIQGTLNDAARLRAECQAQMLSHFYEVSRTMSPEQGKRYLTWVRSKTLAGNGGMHHEGDEHSATH